MGFNRDDVEIKLQLVNQGMVKRSLPRFGIDYNTKGSGVYCLKQLRGVQWIPVSNWMNLTNFWYFLDGMLSLMIQEGD
jgi:hypothetical protein